MDQQVYKNVFDHLGDALLVVERTPTEFRVVELNRAWERLYGHKREECLGSALDRLFPEAIAAQLAAACTQSLASRTPHEATASIPLAGSPHTHEWRVSPVVDGAADRIVLLARDIGDAAAQAASYRNVFDQTSDLIGHFDKQGRILYFNTAMLRSLNFGETDVVGRTWMELWPNPDGERYHRLITDIVQTGTPQEVEYVYDLPAGRTWYQVRYTPGRNADGEVISFTSVARDITALKLIEEKLRQSEQQYRTLTENSPDCILRYDREQRMIYANPTLERVTGVPVTHLLGMKLGEIRASGAVPNSENEAGPIHEALVRVLHEGAPLHIEMRERNPLYPDGLVYTSFILVPERDANGSVESVLAIGRDITQLKTVEADLRVLNATLEERVAARTSDLELANRDLKSFAYTVSHDLRSPLRTIIGFTALLVQDEGERLSTAGRELLERLSAATMKLDQLIEDILQYSHASQVELLRRPVALEHIARDVATELQVQYPHTRVRVGELPLVNGDPTMLRQVVQNLLGNALKFSAQRAQPVVEFDWLQQDGQSVFFVRDNGAGFDMRYAHKLGSMFQRLHTQRQFPGSGVGLAIVQRLIERHGGRLWANSEPNAGATFYFTLPGSIAALQTVSQ